MIRSFDAQKVNEVIYRRNNRGAIIKVVQEKYLRRDIADGFQPELVFDFQASPQVYIVDESFILSHFDLLENYPSLLHNLIFAQSSLMTIDQMNRTLAAQLRDMLQAGGEEHSTFAFLNQLHSATYINQSALQNLLNSQRQKIKILKILEYYQSQAASQFAFSLSLLTVSDAQIKAYHQCAQEGVKRGIFPQQFLPFISKTIKSATQLVTEAEQKYPEIGECVTSYALDSDSQKKQDIYDQYLEEVELRKGLKQGLFFEGPMLVSRVNKQKGTVRLRALEREIAIEGAQNMNRALHGDIVYIQLLPETQWISQASAAHLVDDAFSALNVTSTQGESTEAAVLSSVSQNLLIKLSSQAYKRVTPTGKVVGIVRRPYRSYAGSLIESNGKKLFLPFNERIMPFEMPMKAGAASRSIGNRYLAKVDAWPVWSDYPLGHIIKLLGKEGEVAVESSVILHEFGIETRPFSQKVLDCLPQEGNMWKITEEERARRADLRHLPICSVDPPGCKDIDDALHCITLPNGNFHVGVHIADVTHFVRPGTAIDREAARRCTTVYLVEKRTDMLPALLTESLCSLVGQIERCAFSVMWQIDPHEMKIVSTEFTKSIIKSKDALNYQRASQIIASKTEDSPLAHSLRGLMKVSRKLKENRLADGALTLASAEVRFRLDDETHNPIDVSSYPTFDTNSMVEQFMLLANISVAEKILEHYPAYSVLRRHPPPKPKEIAQFGSLLGKLGNKGFSSSNSKELAESLDAMAGILKDQDADKLVRMMATRCMHQAQYFCTGEFDFPDFQHYGLAVPLYTHFTSPIRRYADVLVHRLLAAALDIDSLPTEITNKFKLNRQCDQMNKKTRMAQLASRASSDLHAFLLFRAPGQVLIEVALISTFDPSEAKAFVHLQKHGLDGELELPSGLNLVFEKPDQDDDSLPIRAQLFAGKNKITTLELFQRLRVQVLASEGSLDSGAKRGVKFLYVGLA